MWDNLLSFSSVILVQGTQAKDTQATLTHTKRQRKFELFNPKPSQLEEQPRLGATVQPYPVIT